MTRVWARLARRERHFEEAEPQRRVLSREALVESFPDASLGRPRVVGSLDQLIRAIVASPSRVGQRVRLIDERRDESHLRGDGICL